MDERGRVSRRRFIQVSSFSLASVNLWAACTGARPTRSLTPDEFRLVETVANQIIPPDRDPGGRDANVARFIERQLRGPYARFASTYRSGLSRLDDTSRRLHGMPFARLPFDQQTALLVRIERNEVPGDIWPPNEAGRFFRLICDHCLQGFYGSPRHGGNLNGASWQMLGFDESGWTGLEIG